jgi:glycosyltransferase involved in cell wall biosynthesis
MVADGHDVVFLTTSAYLKRQSEPPVFESSWTEIDEGGICLHVLRSNYSNELGFLGRVTNFFSYAWRSCWKGLRIGKFDFIYATSTPLLVGIPAIFLSVISRRPFYFEVRDLWPELPIAVGALKNPILIWLTRFMEKSIYRRAKKIIALSPGMKDGVIKSGVPESKVVVVPNSCDIDLFSVSAKEKTGFAEDHLDFVQGRKLVVYTGTIGPINDLFYLVDLVAEVSTLTDQVSFLVVGEGKEREAVMRYAADKDVLDSSLYFWRGRPKSEIRMLLSCADMAMSLFADKPEMQANSANKFFDALASGTPIAINYGGWQKDIVESTNCGLVLDRAKMNQSARRLISAVLDDSIRSMQSVAAAKLARGRFARDHVYEGLRTAIFPDFDGSP